MGNNMTGDVLGTLFVVSIILIVIFLVCREIFCWYWKINQNIALLTEIRDLLAARPKSGDVIEQQAPQRKCPSCGTGQSPDNVFCEKCGTKIA